MHPAQPHSFHLAGRAAGGWARLSAAAAQVSGALGLPTAKPCQLYLGCAGGAGEPGRSCLAQVGHGVLMICWGEGGSGRNSLRTPVLEDMTFV